MKKQTKQLIIGAVIIGILLIFFQYRTFSIVSYNGYTYPQTETINWNGIELNVESTYLGNILGDGNVNICGNNDREVSLINSISTNNALRIDSSLNGRCGNYGDLNKENWIKVTGTFPKGRIYGNYFIKSNWDGVKGWSTASLSVPGGNALARAYDPNNVLSLYQTDTFNKQFELILEEPTEVEILIHGDSEYSSYVNLNFEPYVEQKNTYYHFENNQCNQVLLKDSEKTENDYSNYEECSINIENENGDNGNNEPGSISFIDKIIKFFSDLNKKIEEFFRRIFS